MKADYYLRIQELEKKLKMSEVSLSYVKVVNCIKIYTFSINVEI